MMRISDWSSDVCSSDLRPCVAAAVGLPRLRRRGHAGGLRAGSRAPGGRGAGALPAGAPGDDDQRHPDGAGIGGGAGRSEEHTSELQSLMRISYAVFCLKKKKTDEIYHVRTYKIQSNTSHP